MIELKKNEYKQITEYAYLCYIERFNSEDEYYYCVAVNSMPDVERGYLDIYGFGNTAEEALLMSVKYLVECGLQGLPFEDLNDLSLKDVYPKIKEEIGGIASPPSLLSIVPDKKKRYGEGTTTVIIDDGIAYASSDLIIIG